MKLAKTCGNIDGSNPKQSKAWLWVAVTPLVTFFQIALSRCSDAARNLLGDDFRGILNSDRYAAYSWVGLGQRQLCARTLKTRIYQNIRASRSLEETRDGIGKATGEII